MNGTKKGRPCERPFLRCSLFPGRSYSSGAGEASVLSLVFFDFFFVAEEEAFAASL